MRAPSIALLGDRGASKPLGAPLLNARRAPLNPRSRHSLRFQFSLQTQGAAVPAPAPVLKKMKAIQDMARYTKEELVKFARKWNRCPPELEYSKLSLVVSPDLRDRNRAAVQQLIGAEDDQTWRQLPAKGNEPDRPEADGAPGRRGPRGELKDLPSEYTKIQKAADVGQTAWRPVSASQSATDLQKAERTIRGILNRLAPEKFEKLFEQLLEIVTSAETLRRTITLVFQKAVSEPTFTFLYADLCRKMSKELPEFPPPMGETKPIAFRKVSLGRTTSEQQPQQNNIGPEDRCGSVSGRRVRVPARGPSCFSFSPNLPCLVPNLPCLVPNRSRFSSTRVTTSSRRRGRTASSSRRRRSRQRTTRRRSAR